MTVNEKIKCIRKEKGLTQKELGDRLGGISQQQIGQWETGRANPKYETLQKIAEALEVNLIELIGVKGVHEQSHNVLKNFNFKNWLQLDINTGKEIPLSQSKFILSQDIPEKEEIHKALENGEFRIIAEDEIELTDNYLKLNIIGKQEARKRVEELTEIKKYTEKEE